MNKIIFFAILMVARFSMAVCPDGKSYEVAMTFDDGPHQSNTPKALSTLKEKKVSANFFVTGANFKGANKKGCYDLMQKQLDEGHGIGSHTCNHIAHSKIPLAEAKENIDKGSEIFGEYITSILRLPYGDGSSFNDNLDGPHSTKPVIKLVNEAGYRHVGWDIDTRDWHPQDKLKLPGRMLEQICKRKGGVILMHDIQKHTVDNLGDWIDAIRAEGHKIVKLSEIKKPNGEIKYPEANICFSKKKSSPCVKSQQKTNRNQDEPEDESPLLETIEEV